MDFLVHFLTSSQIALQTWPGLHRSRKLIRTDRVGAQSEPEGLDACGGPKATTSGFPFKVDGARI
jgi:hypothetical protein